MAGTDTDQATHVSSDVPAPVNNADDLFGTLGEICAVARLCLGFDRCSVTLIEADGETLRTAAYSVREPRFRFNEIGTAYPLQDFPMATQSARNQMPWSCNDLNEAGVEPAMARHLPEVPQIRGVCEVPLIVDDATVGFLSGFHFDRPQCYDDKTLEVFTAIGRLTAKVLNIARPGPRVALPERRYRELIELSGDLVFTWSAGGSIVYASPAAYELCGAREGMAWTDLIDRTHPEDRQRTLEAWEQWKTATELLHFENRMLSRVGKEHRIHWNIYPVRNEAGELTHIQGIGRDLTGRHELAEKLKSAQLSESIVRLTRGLAHEFNNMLVSVLGNASVLASQLDQGHPWRRVVDDIANGADRAAKLTRQLMTYARSTRRVPQRRRLRDLLTECLELGQTALPANIKLDIRAEAENDWIEADAMQIEQVLLNLALNAAEAMPEGGVVTVRTADAACGPEAGPPGSCCVALFVEDTGVGIADEDRQRIFDPFFSTKELGRGLGLAAVQGIVQAHGGTIAIEAHAGGGTVAKVVFPLADPPEEPR